MNHIIKDIDFKENIKEIDDDDLVAEWKVWNEEYKKNHTQEVCEKGKPIYDKIRKRYGINNLIQIGYLKYKTNQLAMVISDIPVEETIYHSKLGDWAEDDWINK